jgi:hypothetical protein
MEEDYKYVLRSTKSLIVTCVRCGRNCQDNYAFHAVQSKDVMCVCLCGLFNEAFSSETM